VRTYGRCGRFLRHALHTFGPVAVIRFFAEHDLACAVEKDGSVFPAVHQASDICRILHEVDPGTMQSRKCPGAFFAGETLDADGPCGGYNLQIAWCTAVLAARSAAQAAALH